MRLFIWLQRNESRLSQWLIVNANLGIGKNELRITKSIIFIPPELAAILPLLLKPKIYSNNTTNKRAPSPMLVKLIKPLSSETDFSLFRTEAILFNRLEYFSCKVSIVPHLIKSHSKQLSTIINSIFGQTFCNDRANLVWEM